GSSGNSRIGYEATPIFSGPIRKESVVSGSGRTVARSARASDSAPGTRLSAGHAAAAAAVPKKRRREQSVVIGGLLREESYSTWQPVSADQELPARRTALLDPTRQ